MAHCGPGSATTAGGTGGAAFEKVPGAVAESAGAAVSEVGASSPAVGVVDTTEERRGLNTAAGAATSPPEAAGGATAPTTASPAAG